jgi:acetoacetyl-CoA synthetase
VNKDSEEDRERLGHQSPPHGVQPDILWSPQPGSNSRMSAFLAHCQKMVGAHLQDYDDLLAWSVADLDQFWGLLSQFAGIRWNDHPTSVLKHSAMPRSEWFPGGTLSYSEHALIGAENRPDEVAIVSVSQSREKEYWTWSHLADQVAGIRSGLSRLGVQQADVVAAYMPNIPETVAAFLAVASLGAVWVSCPPEFGFESVLSRLSQVMPSVLLAVDGYNYGNKAIDRRSEIATIRAGLPSVRTVIHLPYLNEAPLKQSLSWASLACDPEPLMHESVSFDHPLYVLFSSGTTGLPKPITHRTGGILIEHWKALALHHDLGPHSRFFWFTTTGWMMWNYLVSGLVVGATIVLFDGDPSFPHLGALWTLAADESVTVFGTGAPYVMAAQKNGLHPARMGDLSASQQVGSTGSPLPPAAFRWLAEELPGVQANSVSGGTDVCTAFVGMNPLVAVWEGEISRPLLGCDVAAYGEDGVEAPIGEQGELVVRQPMPSMPVGLWGDPDDQRLRAAYFNRFPGLWHQGDWITFTERASCIISGRSDATLNRGGVRFGTADLYAVLESRPDITDSLAVHLEDSDQLILFIVAADGELTEAVTSDIKRELRQRLSPRHVPDSILAVPTVPRTLTGKKLEVPVKRILQGANLGDVASGSALADPDSLQPFVELAGRFTSGWGATD